MATISLAYGTAVEKSCVCALVVPQKAIAEPGYIKGFSTTQGGSSKHELQALAQTAYYQCQDDELEINYCEGPISVTVQGEDESIDRGMVLYRDRDNAIKAVIHEGLLPRKLLETANRFCTRWVRLDI